MDVEADQPGISLPAGASVVADTSLHAAETMCEIAPVPLGGFVLGPILGVPKFTFRRALRVWQRNKFWNELIMGRSQFYDSIVPPDMLTNQQVVPGVLREERLNPFDLSGALGGIQGAMIEYFEFLNRERIIPIGRLIGRKGASMKIESWTKVARGLRLRDSIRARSDSNTFAIGGWVPNPVSERLLTVRKPSITFRDLHRPDVDYDSSDLAEVRSQLSLPPVQRQDGWSAPNWVIVQVDESERIHGDPLIEPKPFPHLMEGEQQAPLHVDGGLIVFSKEGSRSTLMAAGARAPASSVLPAILQDPGRHFSKTDRKQIRDAVDGTGAGGFSMAVEIVFRRGPASNRYVWGRVPTTDHVESVRLAGRPVAL